MSEIICSNCKYFYITYKPRFPYGCDLMGFKSKITPCLDVVRLDGQRCLGYVEKELNEIRNTRAPLDRHPRDRQAPMKHDDDLSLSRCPHARTRTAERGG